MFNNSVESNTLGLRLNGVNTRKEESDNASYYVGFLKYDSSGRPQIIYFDSNFYYNPYSETLFATNFSGSIVSTSVNITSDTASTGPQYLTFVAGIGTQNVKIAMSSGYVYYPSTDTLSTLGNLSIGTVGYGVSGPQSALYISGQNSTDTKTTAGVHIGQDQANTYASIALITSSVTGIPYIKFAVSGTAYDGKIEYDCGDDIMKFYINAATPSLVDFSTNEIKLTGNGYSRLKYNDEGAGVDKKLVVCQNIQGAFNIYFSNDLASAFHYPFMMTREAGATLYADITKFSCNAFIVYEKTGTTQALNIDNVNTTINSLYALGVNDVALPLVPLVVKGSSGPVLGSGLGGIFHITTGTGVQLDNKIMMGLVDGLIATAYGWIQTIDPDIGFTKLCLNPAGGNVGVGTTAPIEKFHVNGNIKTEQNIIINNPNNPGVWYWFFNCNSAANNLHIQPSSGVGLYAYPGASTFNSMSDDRVKHNEVDITNGLDIVMQLKPQVYNKTAEFLDADFNGNLDDLGITYHKNSGFIAQEIYSIDELKHLVNVGNEQEPWFFDYIQIIPYNSAAIKELKVEIDNLQTIQQENIIKITNLENELNLIKQHLNL